MSKNRFLFVLFVALLALSTAGVRAWAMAAPTGATAVPQATTGNPLWGMVSDSSGNPLTGIAPTVTGATAVITPSNSAGFYALTVPTNTLTYTVQWDVPGYGSLPATTYHNQPHSLPTNIVLPPVNNLVQNTHFEEDLKEWNTGGTLSPVLDSLAAHTGTSGALSGVIQAGNITHISDQGMDPMGMLADPNGSLHTFSYEPGQILYRQRTPDGVWHDPVNIAGPIPVYGNYYLQTGLDVTGTLHVVWSFVYAPDIYYTQRQPNGEWSTPEIVATNRKYDIEMVVASDGFIHLSWATASGIEYTQRSIDGHWGVVEYLLTPLGYIFGHHMLVDSTGLVYIVGRYVNNNNPWLPSQLYLHHRTLEGIWSEPTEVSSSTDSASSVQLFSDANGTIHIIWSIVYNLFDGYRILYRQWDNGTLTNPEIVATGGTSFASLLGSDERVYVIFPSDDLRLWYKERSSDGVWSSPLQIPHSIGNPSPLNPPQIAFATNDTIYISWLGAYTSKNSTGVWGPTNRFFAQGTPTGDAYRMVLLDNEPVFSWAQYGAEAGIYYSDLELSQTDNDATLTQVVTIPVTMTTPILSFMYQLDHASVENGIVPMLTLDNGDVSTPLWTGLSDTIDWSHVSTDLTPWAGQTVTLTFNLHEVANNIRPGFLLDEVTLGSGQSDVAVNMGETSALPGTTAVYHLGFANHGGAPAPTSTLTFTLPAVITFVSASITPTAIISEHVLVWELGTLPGKDWQSLTVSGTVTKTAVFGDTYTQTLTIATTATESQTGNNTLTRQTVIGYAQFLPIIRQTNP